MRLLIADDDRALSVLLSTRLRALGWTVDVAHDAMQALMFALRSSPDVIMLDIDALNELLLKLVGAPSAV